MIQPAFLRPGDTVAIVAPARKISPQEIAPAVRLLEKAGYRVHYDDRLFAEDHQFAGPDALRAAYIQEQLDNPDIKAVWCARGGYGSVRIIDRLNFRGLAEHPKWICGFSDVTVFHSHLNRHLDMATLHSAMPLNVHEGEFESPANQSLLAALSGEPLRYEIPAHPFNRPATVHAPVVGGNISMLYSLLGSPSDLDTEGKILFLEDLDEYLYHIDRMMANLDRNGKLRHIAALLVGHLSEMHDNTIPFGKNAEEIVAEYAYKYDFPCFFNFPAGHLPDNRAIRLGVELHITPLEKHIITEN